MPHPVAKPLVDSVLLANSAFNASTIAEWEVKLADCEHTVTLDQSQAHKVTKMNMAKCDECDIATNLWMCMHCGHLGCGRKNWDGSGANNHAVDHGQNFEHHLVCKMGTITPEGKASIFCYKCDDDVHDSMLAEHMGVLGIDIKQQSKTEKTTEELNLEMNLNFTLSKVIEDGKQLVPAFGAGLTGMENLGNSCYMNSVVQILFSQPEFRDYYVKGAVEYINSQYNIDDFQLNLRKVIYAMNSGEYSQKKLAVPIHQEGK